MNVYPLLPKALALLALCSGISACSPGTPPGAAPAPPALQVPERGCQTRGDASHRARYCMAKARAHIGSYPFSPDRGLEALAWLGEASACFGQASQPAQQVRAARLASHFRAQLERDLRTEQLRLEHALEHARSADLTQATRFLTALLSSQPKTPYSRWLERVARSAP